MSDQKKNLEDTITIRASQEFKEKLEKLAGDATKEVTGKIKLSDLVRLGLDWVVLHNPTEVVSFLVGDTKLNDHL